ncbi:MAG: hypothetical protein OPY06_03190 [Nitrosopumilus sp.]|nr:hypothetical protein [Nitrosopumilus sp.]MDF2423085.1 hypothetical protein [Nitrosopumilus sp.]MDF2424285.1 hypothetical protein [Nitrosopumilus sp.]MDF2425359.1 hypothetical protein [Nitrosopumilus sp.]MDF2427097.1 hypothetical protein [Nitrosopumilus sp.]
MQKDRLSEWFVPKFGSQNFRLSIGILFLPYTGMVISFAIWGSLSVESSLDRIVSISLLYFFAIGISAHCLDALGSKKKPWGDMSRSKLWIASIISLIISFSVGLYYAFLDSWLLIPIGIAEGFFLFTYNLELFRGKFHNNLSFVISWGILPVFAGAAIQSNSISVETIIFSAIAGLVSYVLIVTSRNYKELKRQNADYKIYYKKEVILKITSSVVIFSTIFFIAIRYL